MKRVAVVILLLMSCERHTDDAESKHTVPVPAAKPVERSAVGNADLRVMLAEIASAKACELMRGQFRPLRAVDRPDVVTGMLWIRDCKITNVGTDVTIWLSGNGWQWAEQQQHKAGGTFAIKQYVKFGMTAALPGALNLAYDRGDHAGFTANVESPSGIAHVAVVCRDQAEAVAAAYAEGRPEPAIKVLVEKDILGKASLRVAKASCPVTVMARLLVPNAREVTFRWQRPAAEIARSTGGPLIACAARK